MGRPFSKYELITLVAFTFSPLTPMSDQDKISPYNINTTSSRQVMSLKKNINEGIVN